jgi:hypothetical protein
MQARAKSNSKAFLVERYNALQRFRSSSLAEPDKADDRRHEAHLRKLVDSGDYESAIKYTEDMALYCESIDDPLAAELYREYCRRIGEFRTHEDSEGEAESVGFY